ncbi:MAG: hypothetical protein ACRC6E_00535 [Fusobacteriaceae bacterium]
MKNIHGKTVKLSVDILDTQNYIAASELLIAKAGWGTLGEGVIDKTPMILLERDGFLEDMSIIKELKKISDTRSIRFEELENWDYKELIK